MTIKETEPQLQYKSMHYLMGGGGLPLNSTMNLPDSLYMLAKDQDEINRIASRKVTYKLNFEFSDKQIITDGTYSVNLP